MHSDLMFVQNPGIAARELRDFENAISIKLPRSYVKYLRDSNGSVPKFGSMHNKASRKYFILERLFPLPKADLTWSTKLEEESLPIVEITPSEVQTLIHQQWLPIGEAIDPDPGILILKMNSPKVGAVHFLDIRNLCRPEQSELCFNGFGDLMDALSKGCYACSGGNTWTIEAQNCSLETIVSLLKIPLPEYEFYVRPKQAKDDCVSLRMTEVAKSTITTELCGASNLKCSVHEHNIRFDFSASKNGKWTKLVEE